MKNINFLTILFVMASFTLYGQYKVKGTILENGSEEPLIGVNVVEKGSTTGTITDIDGQFEISVSDREAVLVISYIGYQTQQIRLEGKKNITISLGEDVEQLEEVVVVGYGVQKKAVVTGAISKVKAEDLENMPVTRIEQSLLGRAAGVRVTGASGAPGDGATVRIRGTTTIGNSDPLYVVDGVPIEGGIDYLNQADIESIEVLKDAASASIYGARSANGVILITTKKGFDGAPRITYNAYYGQQAPWRKLAYLNATEYATLMNEASVASGEGIIFDDPRSFGEGTNWQDLLFREDAPIMDHSLTLATGTKKSNYFISFGYFDQEGIISQDKSRYRRFTARFNSDHKVNDKLKIGNSLGYTRILGEGIPTNTEFGSPLSRALNIDPITPLIETNPDVLNSDVFLNFPIVRNEAGQPYGISEFVTSEIVNPIAALETINGFGWSDKFVGNIFAEYEIIEGLKFKSSLGTDLAFWGGEGFNPIFYLNSTTRNDITQYDRSANRGLKWILSNTLSYSKLIGVHDINVVAGASGEGNSGRGLGGSIRDIPVTDFEDASLSFPTTAESQTFGGFEFQDRLASYFGRANYNFNQKYLLSATLRIDGSSKFGANNRFGFFPSASVGWVPTEEDFLASHPIINFLKLRASWGVNGNNRIGDFRFVSTVGGGRNFPFGLNDQLVNGVSPNAIANPDLRWEETTQTNFGIDAKIFKNISVTFDVFEKLTTGMLLDIAVPGYVGNQGPVGNIATMSNRGVELELGFTKTFGDFAVNLSGNVSYIENEVTDLGPEKEFLPGQRIGPPGIEVTRTSVGLPIWYLFGYQTDGIFQTQDEVNSYLNADGSLIQPEAAPGDFRFVDFDGDGDIDADDRTIIGDPTPTWTYGMNFAFDYKGFDLLMFGQGVGGNDVYQATRRFDLQMANLRGDALERWTGPGTSNTYPRLVMNDPNRNFSRSSDFYVKSGAFFRIKTLQLGYNLPQSILEKLKMQKLRFYISGNNLITITDYDGFDPEIGGQSFGVDRGAYPQSRFFLFGLNVSF